MVKLKSEIESGGVSVRFMTSLYSRLDGSVRRKDYPVNLHNGLTLSQASMGGGKRGKIKGFSKGSRKRLFDLVTRCDYVGCQFVTLTLGSRLVSPEEARRLLRAWLKGRKRKNAKHGEEFGCIWKMELQKRGQPHFHLLVWGSLEGAKEHWVDLVRFTHGNRVDLEKYSCDIETIVSTRGVISYASKYLGKDGELLALVGCRVWGKEGSLPIVEDVFLGEVPTQKFVEYKYLCSFGEEKGCELGQKDWETGLEFFDKSFYYGLEAEKLKELMSYEMVCKRSSQGEPKRRQGLFSY